MRITPCSASIRLIGQLVSRTFVHQKANVGEANTAVKQDIIRSLASRLEMHWASLIEEENGSPEGICFYVLAILKNLRAVIHFIISFQKISRYMNPQEEY